MGALISAIMCLVILSPVSSAALAVGLGLNGLAAGAAVIGCACSMIGFAVCSYPKTIQSIGTNIISIFVFP